MFCESNGVIGPVRVGRGDGIGGEISLRGQNGTSKKGIIYIILFFYSANSCMADRCAVQDIIKVLININVNHID